MPTIEKKVEKQKVMLPFKVLKYNQALMAKIGIYSYRLTEPTNEFFNSSSTYFILFHVIVFVLIGGIVYATNNVSDFTIVLETCVTIIGGIQCGGMYLSIGLKMRKVKALHLKLQKIVDDAVTSRFFGGNVIFLTSLMI